MSWAVVAVSDEVMMSRAERLELGKLVRLRARVAKDDVGQREAHLLADVEAQLAAEYKANHEAWKDITERAKRVVAEADAEIVQRCRELGIREDFRPQLNLGWYGRGSNADASRRAELRKVAQTRLAASAKAAKVEIDREAAGLLTQLAAGSLESSADKGFLDAMPSIDELMPRITLPESRRCERGPAVSAGAGVMAAVLAAPDAADVDPVAWATRYIAGGLAVLPLHWIGRGSRCSCGDDDCHSPGKHPLTAHGKDDATTEPEKVAAWWRRWPHANVGVRPPAGVAVLDVDPRHGGASALLALTRTHGALTETLTARTGSGGLHLWYAHAGRARGALCRGVDVKTASGYLVAPPSRHASGRRYAWLTEVPTAPAPRWVRQILAPPPPARVRIPPRVASGDRIGGLVRYIQADPGGELNYRLFWASSRAHEGGLDVAPLVAAAVALGHPEGKAWATAGQPGDRESRRRGGAR